ncbi:ANTAR domain-containing protein [Paenarthrobacter sp. RAF54_2]
MAQNRCSRDAAFQILVSASSHRNIKLRVVAQGIIAHVAGDRKISAAFEE